MSHRRRRFLWIFANYCERSEQCPLAYTGAHKKVIPQITIMASVRRGW